MVNLSVRPIYFLYAMDGRLREPQSLVAKRETSTCAENGTPVLQSVASNFTRDIAASFMFH
jgi:hypothetical protein